LQQAVEASTPRKEGRVEKGSTLPDIDMIVRRELIKDVAVRITGRATKVKRIPRTL